ncbi:MAG TPA: STAS domain-containing protein [Conexibacter sp.]|nr:STAS domain-containing protein [Conexibacter sp.]
MRPLAHVATEADDDVSVAAIEGEVDASNVEGIGVQLRALLTNHSHALVVDLRETHYLDSAGLNLLFALVAELDHRQQRLHVVVDPASHVARTLQLVNLAAVAAVHPTRAEALADAR